MQNELQKLTQFLTSHAQDFNTGDPDSVSEILYLFYAECYAVDSPGIQEYYEALNAYVCHLPFRDQNAVSDILCGLCTEHEKAAFFHGLKLGARLIQEVAG